MTTAAQLRSDFGDDTEYERLVLDTIVVPSKAPAGAEFATCDIRGSGPRNLAVGVHDSLSAGAVESFAGRFRPLAFGAAYKIVDFLVEMTMRLNGEPSPRGRWTFAEKAAYVRRGTPPQLPSPLDAAPSLWERAAQLYLGFGEHRHALAHRRARVDPSGDFTGSDRAGSPLVPITVAQQDAFSWFALVLANSVIAGHADQRQLNAIAWQADALAHHHGLAALGATQPASVIAKVTDDFLPMGPGSWKVDGVKLHAFLREQNRPPLDADVEYHASDGGKHVVYLAHAYEVPDAIVEIDETALPTWLRRTAP